jgi:small conductance mechanosensitive channel
MDYILEQLKHAEGLIGQAAQYGVRALYALVIWLVALSIAKIVERGLRSSMQKNKRIDVTFAIFAASLAKYTVLALALIAVLNMFGVDTTSLIAILGAASLAVGLALQGTLSSFAAGFMIVFFRPYKVGDEVSVGAHKGVVQEINMFNTELTTGDNAQITIPNKDAWGSAVTNYTAQKLRRVDLSLEIEYKSSLDDALGAMNWAFEHDPRVLRAPEAPAPFVGLTALSGGVLEVTLRVWCTTPNYAAVRIDLIRRLKEGFDGAGVVLAKK